LQEGYAVTGVYLECWRGPGCRAEEDRKDALDVALSLGIPFEVLDFKEAYKETVVDYFYREYQAGRTPNPDVACNREIKFGLFYDWALNHGFDAVATGHYARVENNKLLRGVDKKKDQSYFLYQLHEEQLLHVLFPVGHLTKTEVRYAAEKQHIQTASKPDSQGICFIGEVRVDDFLKSLGMKERMGEVLMGGEVVGTHKGAWFYTVGQRHGFTIRVNNPDMPSLFIIKKDVEKNQLVVGTKEQLFTSEFTVGDIHWIGANVSGNLPGMQVRVRHGGELVEAALLGSKVTLTKPVFGIAPGQAAVFYDQDVCLGGGIIQ
jgi:tRNA-uridine 2-sulfurtransferase